MTFKTPGAAVLLIISIFAAGCSSAWSKRELNQLASVSVSPATFAQDAYHKPDGTDSPKLKETLPLVTGLGILAVPVGSIADHSVTSRQQGKFEETQGRYFDAIKKAMAAPPIKEVTAALKQGLGEHEFFRTRLVEKSATTFSATVTHYGLQKAWPSSATNDHLRIRLVVAITLKTPDGTVMFDEEVIGLSAVEKPAAEIIASPNFFTQGYVEAAKEIAEQLSDRLARKFYN